MNHDNPSLFDPSFTEAPEVAPVRRTSGRTERQAARKVGPNCPNVRAWVLAQVKESPAGMTRDELHAVWCLHVGNPRAPSSTVYGRASELIAGEYLRETDQTRLTAAGNEAAVLVWTGKAGDGSERPPSKVAA
jgi:hypothetical protein